MKSQTAVTSSCDASTSLSIESFTSVGNQRGHVLRRISSAKTVAILLCTYQGQRFLREQLDSIATQSYQNWTVWASDDGSVDGTREILEQYSQKWGPDRLVLDRGPSEGFVANFLTLACKTTVNADFYAFADQDDIWESDKLSKALATLLKVPEGVAGLYCGRTRLVDEQNREIGYSPLFRRKPSFNNALVQSIAGGNTMVFNAATRSLLLQAEAGVEVASHDWWAYLLVSGCGGTVFYDARPTIRYRQHDDNLVGSNGEWSARLMRIRWLLKGRFRIWSDQHVAALQKVRDRMTPENKYVFDFFTNSRQKWLLPRLIGLKKCKLYRQTFFGNIGLCVAAIMNKI